VSNYPSIVVGRELLGRERLERHFVLLANCEMIIECPVFLFFASLLMTPFLYSNFQSSVLRGTGHRHSEAFEKADELTRAHPMLP